MITRLKMQKKKFTKVAERLIKKNDESAVPKMNVGASTSRAPDRAVPGPSRLSSNVESHAPQAGPSGCSNTSSVAQKNDEKTRKLYLVVYKFLQQQLSENQGLDDTQRESLEVVINCLGYAFQFYEFDYVEHSLPKVYEFFEKHKHDSKKKHDVDPDECEIPPEDIVQADEYKENGNKLMREEKFKEALEFYEKAIRLNPKEAALYCNRAAAFHSLNRYKEAIEDCNTALTLNFTYAKAYVRKGVAYEKLKDNKRALKSYKKAYQLEPENESYKNLYTEASKRFKQRQDESTSTSSSSFNMLLGPQFASLPFSQLPEFGNLMESLFGNVERQWPPNSNDNNQQQQDPQNRDNSSYFS